jgi:hypothetical protein
MDFTLYLSFITSSGKKSSMTIPGVRSDITKDEVSDLMNLIIEKNIFLSDKGFLVSAHSAKVTEKRSTELV